jgi:hypothetical protein
MICDSDKTSPDDPLDPSKMRLKAECERVGGYCWVTDGREIENYLPDTVLTKAFQVLLASPDLVIALPQWQKLSTALRERIPNPMRGDGWKADYDMNKARIMPELLKHLTTNDLSRFELSGRLEELVRRIKSASPQADGRT